MNELIVQKVTSIINSCTNEQHIQVASQTVNLVCFEPGVGLTTNQTNTLLELFNKRVKTLQSKL